jgi:hypothetical protein
MPIKLRPDQKVPLHWMMPRTKCGRDELKKRNGNILRVLPLINDQSIADFIKSNLVLSEDGTYSD